MAENPQKVANNPLGSYPVAVDRADQSNLWAERQAVGIDIGAVVGGVWTPNRISSANPFPVTDSSVSPVPATQSLTTNVSTSSITLVAANSARKGGYIVFPISNTASVYVSLNTPATSANIEMLPGSNFYLTLGFGGPPITNIVYGIAASGTQKFIVVEG